MLLLTIVFAVSLIALLAAAWAIARAVRRHGKSVPPETSALNLDPPPAATDPPDEHL